MIVRAPQFYTVIENSIFLSQSSFDLMIFYGYHFLNNKHKNRVKKGETKVTQSNDICWIIWTKDERVLTIVLLLK